MLLVFLALFGSCLYAWQVFGAWQDHMIVNWDSIGPSLGFVNLTGRGVASGAAATVFFNTPTRQPMVQLEDMPALPVGQAYQLWCITDTGDIDASSVFHISFDGQDSSTQVMIPECQHIQLDRQAVVTRTPHSISQYHHFMITIEPDGGSKTAIGQVVMAD